MVGDLQHFRFNIDPRAARLSPEYEHLFALSAPNQSADDDSIPNDSTEKPPFPVAVSDSPAISVDSLEAHDPNDPFMRSIIVSAIPIPI